MDEARASGAHPRFRARDYEFELTGDPELVGQLTELFTDLRVDRVLEPHRWKIDVFGGHARVVIDGGDAGEWVRRDLLPPLAMSTLTMAVIGSEPELLHLHAGAVVDSDRTLLLLAPSGSGKSTLTCALVASGATYRTDEAVALDPAGDFVRTFPKPLSVKRAGVPVVEHLTGLRAPRSDRGWEIPASAFADIAPDDSAPVTTLVFNEYLAGRPPSVEALHRASALRLVLSDSQDASVIGPESLLIAARLVAGASCVRATGGDAAEVASLLLETHRGHVERGAVELIGNAGPGGGPSRAPDVSSVVVDGRAVLYSHVPQRVIELDDAQTAWWVLLDGTPLVDTVGDVAAASGEAVDDVGDAASRAIAVFDDLGLLSDRGPA